MFAVLVYDIPTDENGRRRYQKIHKLCLQKGFWVNGSVFELDMDYSSFLRLKHQIEKIMDVTQDSVRVYVLGKRTENNVLLLGKRVDVESSDETLLF